MKINLGKFTVRMKGATLKDQVDRYIKEITEAYDTLFEEHEKLKEQLAPAASRPNSLLAPNPLPGSLPPPSSITQAQSAAETKKYDGVNCVLVTYWPGPDENELKLGLENLKDQFGDFNLVKVTTHAMLKDGEVALMSVEQYNAMTRSDPTRMHFHRTAFEHGLKKNREQLDKVSK
jgi:hypothetical protein